MEKVLVTGGAGFIGSHLVDELVKKRHYKVTVFDNLEQQVHPDGLPEYYNIRAKFIRGDVRNKRQLKEVVIDSDIVVHLAAAVGVGQSQYQIAKYVDSNIQGTANLLDILANEKHNVKKLVIASSMSIYGEGLYECKKCGKVKPPLRNFKDRNILNWETLCPDCKDVLKPVPTPEDTPLMSNSIYAITKKEQEEMSLLIGRTYGIPVVALRFFNVYGPRQSLSNPYTGVAAIFLSRIKNNKPPVIYEDGLQTRDFIWVGDIVNACLLSIEKEEANHQVFNVGTGNPVSILKVAETLIELLGKKGKVHPDVTYKFRKGDVRHCYADITRIKKILGFKPEISFEEGMKKLINWAKRAKAVDKFEKASQELKKKKLV
ncbi:MAG: GDP-mannose 4,6-dehydratase [Candidatus Omnitrophica bacterium]|nr:GDP-mannose 4,6-dehydratase [Candidatus Omnitrophota bacterium]